MASKRNFFLLFDMDGATSKGRSGYNVGRGPKKVCKTTGIDTGVMWGRLCYRSDENSNAHIGVRTSAQSQPTGKVKLTMTLNIPAGAVVETFSDGSMTVTVTSEYTP